jgi:hypothetical protein
MSTIVVRYRTKPEHADENERLVAAVYAELAERGPDGFAYMTFRPDDGTFVHIADVEGESPLGESEAFSAFQAGLGERCEEGPNPQPATLVGSYRVNLG